jgi:light-regulated signal transduction histidine kinase (bacteriophytochrome)
VKGKVSFNEDGQPVRLLGLVQEITEQKLFAEELKRQVDEQTNELSHANSELKKINQELEQFAYISSHDLQEPLRKIKMFSSMILERDGNQLSDYSKSKFSKVVDAADRMSRSLRDLLNYASTGKEVAAEEVDLNEVVKMVENDLELMISQKNAIIKTEGLPLTTAIPLQMHQLFYNLINNALKFSKADVPPIIEISCQFIQKSTNQSTKTYYQIKVQDNGIGFEAYGVDKIFGIFQRMHDRHTYDGTGIGLALCKKVVENHDGEIFATAVPGQGACFTILLPQ